MAVVRWDPWREIAALERQLDQAFGRFNRPGSAAMETKTWMPAVDVYQEGEDMVIRAELAGVAPEDVEITVDDSVLRISGTRKDDTEIAEGDWVRRERFVGHFERDIALPQGTDPGSIQASAEHGVIAVRVPRPKATEPRRIELSSSSSQKAQAIDLTTTDEEKAEDKGEQKAEEKADR